MSLFGGKEKQEIKELKMKIDELNNKLLPEHNSIDVLNSEIAVLAKNKNRLATENNELASRIRNLNIEINNKDKLIIQLDDEALMQSFGLYKPRYHFQNAEIYHNALENIRNIQKGLIKTGGATTGNMSWTVDGNAAKGKKMVADMQKLLLRAFNSECDEIVDRVKYNNYDASLKRITVSYEAITKLGAIMNVQITKPYYNAKIDELTLALEYQQKKQQEKDDLKELRAQERENAKLQREIEELRKKSEKEQSHYLTALAKINIQLENASGTEKIDLLQKQSEIQGKLDDVEKAIKDVDYRLANQRAGYVYIISNIGAFGENIYKIGMTRRLNPEERIDELSDASVPFDFDVHAMIFCDDAPALESALHRAFETKKLNWINLRREFFNVSLDEIKSVVKANFDKTVEFIDVADAEQYRLSQKLKTTLS